MTPERWQQVKQILEATLEQETSSRPEYLAEVCEGDEELRRDVESLLAHSLSDDFLEQSAVGRKPPVPDGALEATPATKTGRVDEVRPVDLAPYTRFVVFTRGSRYECIVVRPLDEEVLVKGGRRFPRRTRARLHGQETIRVGDVMQLQVGASKVVTSTIEAIEVLET